MSSGERMMELSNDAVVVTRRVARGAAVARISGVGIPEVEMDGRSVSGKPRIAAINDRRNISVVRERMPQMNVALVPFHIDSAPEVEERDERASRSE